MLITYQKLHYRNACTSQLDLLEETFPGFREHGIEITADNLMTAYEAGVNLEWFVYEFVPIAIYQKIYVLPKRNRRDQRTRFIMSLPTVLCPTQDQSDKYELMVEMDEAASACELMACILSYAERANR